MVRVLGVNLDVADDDDDAILRFAAAGTGEYCDSCQPWRLRKVRPTYPKITLDERPQLVISVQHPILAYSREPFLKGEADEAIVFNGG